MRTEFGGNADRMIQPAYAAARMPIVATARKPEF